MSPLVAVEPSSNPCTDPPRLAPAKQGDNAAILNQIYDVHRISAMNAAYFAWKVEQISSWSQIYDGAIAISTALTAGSGLSTLFFMPQNWVKALTASLASLSAVMAAARSARCRPSSTRQLRHWCRSAERRMPSNSVNEAARVRLKT